MPRIIFILIGSFFLSTTVTSQGEWKAQNVPPTQNKLECVYFTDADNGWTVGREGTILRTTDGGNSWEEQPNVISEYLKDVFFIDKNRGWIVGSGGLISHTNNGGDSWIPQSQKSEDMLRSVYFINSETGWVVGYFYTGVHFQSRILFTTDGGKSWIHHPQESEISAVLNSVYFSDANNGWIVGDTILYTSDGGANWLPQSSGISNYHLYSVFFKDSNIGWAAGHIFDPGHYFNGVVIYTTDAGKHWNNSQKKFRGDLFSISFINGQVGWAVGLGDTIYQTTDGGKRWTGHLYGQSELLQDIYFTDSQNGWVVGSDGLILQTTDGGIDWLSQSSGIYRDISSVFFVNKNTGWAVGEDGLILHTTTDSLNSWKEKSYFTHDFQLFQNFPNPFNPVTSISYQVGANIYSPVHVDLSIYNLIGQKVATLVSKKQPAGQHQVTWDASDFASGIYYYMIKAGEFRQVKKMVLVR